ncbi:type III toxin-antitoxin system CptIN family toxin [Floccifex sp.]|uniref:type III toxin-antitoxin system CptIN family toxin n=1 Tax=Floccifex sp. TaxID=2815810 RepID=UPI003EFD3CF5
MFYFPDEKLMKNKEMVNGVVHDRPCFFAFEDNRTGLFWLIPFSSQVQKYKKIYAHKISKYGFCNTIMFGKVLGHEKAFLLQNM